MQTKPLNPSDENSRPVFARLESQLTLLPKINLSQMEDYELLRRMDTKYVIDRAVLLRTLTAVRNEYRVLEIGGVRINPYHTRYFDTSQHDFYMQQHNQVLPRFKVRTRTYMTTGDEYLEVKMSDQKNQTHKTRMARDSRFSYLSENEREFLREHLPIEPNTLRTSLENKFLRFTLVGKEQVERVTVDLDVRFFSQGIVHSLGEAVILEVKQEKFSYNSPVITALRRLGVRPLGFSKYCMGLSSYENTLKKNRFKSRYLFLEALQPEGIGGFHYGYL